MLREYHGSDRIADRRYRDAVLREGVPGTGFDTHGDLGSVTVGHGGGNRPAGEASQKRLRSMEVPMLRIPAK